MIFVTILNEIKLAIALYHFCLVTAQKNSLRPAVSLNHKSSTGHDINCVCQYHLSYEFL
jgi:hypothetical protein